MKFHILLLRLTENNVTEWMRRYLLPVLGCIIERFNLHLFSHPSF